MKIALIAPPFIPVPPVTYGGTELFTAELARELSARGHRVIVYANGASALPCEVRWLFREPDWPPGDAAAVWLKNAEHTAWALRDVERERPDVVHTNDALAVAMSAGRTPAVHTLHHPHEPALSELYARHPQIHYVAISDSQRAREPIAGCTVIHHGVALDHYPLCAEKEPYLCFLGRIAPIKGTHLAALAAVRAGRPLKIAGEIQPIFRDYWESAVLPLVDGKRVEYVGEADHATKVALLSRAAALLFPVQWEEPFGLVMIEAMACGTPVLALPGGAVREVVEDGLSGWVCRDLDELAARAAEPGIDPAACRASAERRFSSVAMVRRYEALYHRAITASRGDVSHERDRSTG